ncbi:MAG: prenyltransferase/squalene oxidase repeat-containing protein [Pirellulaceae bacterium]
MNRTFEPIANSNALVMGGGVSLADNCGAEVGVKMRAISSRRIGLIRAIAFSLVILTLGNFCWVPAHAYTPESPKVKAMVAKAVDFLKDKGEHYRVGGKALVAMTLLKTGVSPEHPRVKAGIDAAKAYAKDVPKFSHDSNYDAGIVLIFLCEYDPQEFAPEIRNLVKYFETTQKPHGGFGYQEKETGDGSMTQYAALGLWLADRNGFEVKVSTVESLLNWVMAVQDPEGAFGYQGVIAAPGQPRKRQDMVRIGLVAAGMGSLYISADFLNLGKKSRKKEVEDNTPVGFTEVKDPEEVAKNQPRGKNINTQMLANSKNMANSWMANRFNIDGGIWKYYYLYALERLQAFREMEEANPNKEPDWYNQGVEFLEKNHSADGSFLCPQYERPVMATCFGILFLIRSTALSVKKAARTFDDGLLTGGRGLPTDFDSAEVQDGKIITKKEPPETDQFLALMESDDEQLGDLLDQGVSFDLSQDERGRNEIIVALRRKLTNGSYAARMLAVQTIKEARDFDSVPVLIFALTDPDLRVARGADSALRFISRKFDGVGMPSEPTPADKSLAVKKWREWYLSIRPDATFLD